MRGPTPLLRLQSDERLIAMVRRGNHAAFEALVARYQSRLLAFCRHMLSSREDAEDVLQEVFAASFNAILADDRPIHVRPWLYRIARNRSLNHLRRAQPIGVDSMDVHLAEGGASTADKAHKRAEFRQVVSDVQDLPETQKTALLLREMDALSYAQIAEAMETTIPAVKSLLVRARVSLAEAAEARALDCDEVREELGEVAEGLRRTSPPVRRHLRECERCQGFRDQLRTTNKALAAVFPVAPLLLAKKALFAHFGITAGAGAGAGAASAGLAGVAAAGGTSAMGAGISTIATKAAAGLAAAAIVTAGAVEVKQVQHVPLHRAAIAHVAHKAPRPITPEVVASTNQPIAAAKVEQATIAADAKAEARARARARHEALVADRLAREQADPAGGGAVAPTAPTQVQSSSGTITGSVAPGRQTGGTAAPDEDLASTETPPADPPISLPAPPPTAPPAADVPTSSSSTPSVQSAPPADPQAPPPIDETSSTTATGTGGTAAP